jgi:Icc-related predicted phosphoesterase
MKKFLRRERERGTRIFFATDLHGSEQCFRKFLSAVRIYNVDHLVMGGDMTGKFLVPIVRESSGSYRSRYGERDYVDLDETGRRELEKTIRLFGHYPVVGTAEELDRLHDEAEREQRFREVVAASVTSWVELAEERLGGSEHRVFVAPGNDDFWEVDRALQGSEVVVFAEGQCLQLGPNHEMITTGCSNPTPWETERELTEEELASHIDEMMKQVSDPGNLVAVLHPPPYDSRIDEAPGIDNEFRLQKEFGGGVTMAPVGSHAVREFIETTQPLLGLHGHVHEGRGAAQIGRTVCINPGSEYTEGILLGAIVELGSERVISHQLVAG